MEGIKKQRAVVFYARDFLATEFPAIGKRLEGYLRVYIVASPAERDSVAAGDPEAKIFQLGGRTWTDSVSLSRLVGVAYNNDRYLRGYDVGTITAIVGDVVALCDEISLLYDVRYYFDEPVSGFPNLYFNSRFTADGARCLHFQTSWIPGFMFFTADPAHADPEPFNLIEDGRTIVRAHLDARSKGSGVPLYVLNYGSAWNRVRDIAITLAKLAYRKYARRESYYLDSDPSAHRLHVKALLGSFAGGYASSQELKQLGGKYVLFPLHYEPESILNYFSPYSRQEEIAEQILDALPVGYELLLKEHPSQPGALNLAKWRNVTKNRRVIKVRGDINARSLLQFDVAVISIGSTLAIEAALAGRPVGVLGKVHYASMPGVLDLASPRDVSRVLAMSAATQEQIEDWYAGFVQRYCFRGNIMKGQTQLPDFASWLDLLGVRRTAE